MAVYAYQSIMYCSSNEHKEKEIQLIYKKGFFRWLFGIKNKLNVYIYRPKGRHDGWQDKRTGRVVTDQQMIEIEFIIGIFSDEASADEA